MAERVRERRRELTEEELRQERDELLDELRREEPFLRQPDGTRDLGRVA